MSMAHRKAVQSHRGRLRQRGLVLLELQASRDDVDLLRQIATALRGEPAEAAAVRARLRDAVDAEAGKSLLDMLASDLPDEAFEEMLRRSRDVGRDVEL